MQLEAVAVAAVGYGSSARDGSIGDQLQCNATSSNAIPLELPVPALALGVTRPSLDCGSGEDPHW